MMKKRVLSILLVVCLIVSLLPVSAFADEVDASGTCGENVTWTLKDGVLTISGTGAMEDYRWDTVPWRNYSETIEKVVVEDGVTSIGSATLDDLWMLVSVEISDTVVSISNGAFYCCNLREVFYSGTVEQWSTVNILDGNEKLYLVTVHCADGDVFPHGICGENLTWTLANGTLAISGTGDMEDYYLEIECSPWVDIAEEIVNVVIEPGVTSIGEYAFLDCTNLVDITVPDTVTIIGLGAFNDCDSLTNVNYSETVEQWEKISIAYDNNRLLTAKIHCTDGDVIPHGTCGENVTWRLDEDGTLTISGMGAMADYDYWDGAPWDGRKDSIINVVIEDGVMSIGSYAFSDCTSLEGIILPDGLKSIGTKAFGYCRNLSTVSISDSVTSIGSYAFDECYELNTVNYAGTVAQWEEINIAEGNNYLITADIHCTDGDVIPHGSCGKNVTWRLDKNGTFTVSGTGDMDEFGWGDVPWISRKDSIETIIVEDGVTSICSSAFSGCYILKSVSIPDSVTSIGDQVFGYCHNLENVVIPEGVRGISYKAFYNCVSLSTVSIPDSVTSIGSYAFDECYELNTVNYAGTVAQWEEINIAGGNNYLLAAKIHCTDGDVAPHGTCGENVTWKLDEDGTLTISGTGAMEDYDWDGAPWYSLRDSIEKIVIEDGVTNIGDRAFEACERLSTVSIPESVTSIGESAFSSCGALESVNYGGTVTQWEAINIADGNFDLLTAKIHCTDGDVVPHGTCGENVTWKLTEDGTLTISGSGAMENYEWGDAPWARQKDSIRNVVIEDGVACVGNCAFSDCYSLSNVRIPESVTSIGTRAFESCESLESVILPDGLNSIGEYAFAWCYNLNDITLPDGLNSIGDYAFSDCTTFSEITLPEKLSYIGEGAFYNCVNIKDIVIPDGVATIKVSTFASCSNLVSASISEATTAIEEDAFWDCTSLSDTYYSGTKAQWDSIKIDTGNGCLQTTVIHCTDGDAAPHGTFGDNITWKLENNTLTISGEGEMPDFYSVQNPWSRKVGSITSVIVEDGVTNVGNRAFIDFDNLKRVALPNSVKSIGDEAFSWCYSLENITIPEGVRDISYKAFYYCWNLSTVSIPESVTSIGESAFSCCDELESVNYGGTVAQWEAINIADGNFDLITAKIRCTDGIYVPHGTCGENVTWKLDENGTLIISGTGDMFDYTFNETAPWFDINSQIESIVIESGVTSIGEWAFGWCFNLNTVKISDTVKIVPHNAFAACWHLGAFVVDENNANYCAVDGVLFNKDKTELVIYPLGMDSEEYTIPNGVKSIVQDAFELSGVQTITIPTSVTTIEYRAFNACDNLGRVNFAGTVAQWKAIDVGEENDALNNAIICCTDGTMYPHGTCGENATWKLDENGVLTISGTGDVYEHDRPWQNLTSQIMSVEIESGITSIGYGAFAACTNLKSADIPNSVRSISYKAFAGCMDLKSITIPDGVQRINEYTFLDCISLETIDIPDTVTSIDLGAFSDCYKLTTVNYGGTVAEWGSVNIEDGNYELYSANVKCTDGVFTPHGTCGENITWVLDENGTLTISGKGDMENYNNPWHLYSSKITSVVIENGITSIGNYAFGDITNIKSVTLPNSLSRIGDYAFCYSYWLETITLPDSLTEIGDYAFSNCTRLKSIVIPEGVEFIGDGAFANCHSIETVALPSSLTEIGAEAFDNCTGLKAIAIPAGVIRIGHGALSGCLRLETIEIDKANENYCTVDGVLFNKNKTALVSYPAGKTAESYEIPNGVTTVTYGTFASCWNLKSVSIPTSVTSIQECAFNGCDNLRDVYYSGTQAQWNAIAIDEENDGFDCAYIHCTDAVMHPHGICGDDLTWELKDGVLTISGTGDMYDFNMAAPWYNAASSIKSIELGSKVTSITSEAFVDCKSLESITLPEGIISVAAGAFLGCDNLSRINISDNNPYYTSVDGMLFNKDKTEIIIYPAGKTDAVYVIPDRVTTISRNAFIEPTYLQEIVIHAGVTNIEEGAFSSCNLNAISVDKDNEYYCSVNGALFSKDKTTLYQYPIGKTADTYQIPDGVNTIAYSAFWGSSNLRSVVIPESVTFIDEGAFISCHSLTDVYYTGTEEQWENVVVDTEFNYSLADAQMHFNYDGSHVHNYTEAVTAPTCTKEGYTTHTCACGDSYVDSYTNALGHDFDAWKQTKAPTCTEKGTETRTCTRCNAFEIRDVASTGHHHNADVTAPTCTAKGYTTHTCACGDSYVDTYTDALGHSYGAWTQTKAPTCTAKGTEVRTCTRCNATETRDVEALGHNTTHHAAKAATCTEIGWDAYDTCSRCNYTTYKEIPATGHHHNADVTAPTCTAKGYTTHTCACGDSYVDSYTDALGHSYGAWTQTKAPTCTAKGTETRTCTRCNASEARDVASLGHNHDAVVTAPTCTEKGYTTHTCACGDSHVDSYTDALGHDFGAWKQTKAPTCTKKGTETRTCTRCNAFEIRDVASTGHHHNADVTAPTCTAKGYTTHTCACGDSYVDTYTDALGHSYGAWTQTKAPTCTAKGTDSRSCTRCGQTEKRDVAALLHDYENGACTRCGAADPNYDPSPEAPELKITTSAGHPKISWNAVDGATKYWVYRSTDGTNFSYYDRTDNTSYTNNSTTIGTLYYYKVKAVKTENGKDYASDYSVIRSIRCKPAAPSISIYRANGKPQLKWSAVDGAAKYWIYRSTDGTNFKYFDSTTKTSYTNSGAASGTKYYYRVKAVAVVNGNNVASANSGTKSLMTTLATPSVSITTSNGKPKLSWVAVTGADKYYVYRSTDGKTFGYWDSTTNTSFTNSGAKKNTKYYYKVKAVCTSNSNANSALSASVSIKATK